MSRSGSIAAKALLILMLTAVEPLQSQPRPPAQTITFASNRWTVRQTTEPEGPMANMFGGRDLSVFLNADGSLTLAIAYREGLWYAGEVTLQKRTGYGTYLFRLRTPPAGLDPNTVLGLFTYSSANAYFHTIVVTGAKLSPDGSPAAFFVNDSGVNAGGRRVPAEQFLQAWREAGSRFIEVL